MNCSCLLGIKELNVLHIRAVHKHLDLCSKPSNAHIESMFCATYFVHVFLLVCYISLNIPFDVLLSKTNLISWPIQRLVSRNYVSHKITPRHAIAFNHEFTLHHVFTVRSYPLFKSGITFFHDHGIKTTSLSFLVFLIISSQSTFMSWFTSSVSLLKFHLT
jgi:hypothetical protein